MERNPWWQTLNAAQLPEWSGRPVGVKEDGGGNIRGQGRVGSMHLHVAAHNKDGSKIEALVEAGEDVNEVEGAGNTPLHAAAYEDWPEGVELLVKLGAKVNASNNAGDTAWHTAQYMGHTASMAVLEKHGATRLKGKVLVQEHVPKVKDFYQKECWAHHPLPYADYVEFKRKEREEWEAARKRAALLASS